MDVESCFDVQDPGRPVKSFSRHRRTSSRSFFSASYLALLLLMLVFCDRLLFLESSPFLESLLSSIVYSSSNRCFSSIVYSSSIGTVDQPVLFVNRCSSLNHSVVGTISPDVGSTPAPVSASMTAGSSPSFIRKPPILTSWSRSHTCHEPYPLKG